jgi:hypothetical protein
MLNSITIESPLQRVDNVDFNNSTTNVEVSLLYRNSEVARNFRREYFIPIIMKPYLP